MKFAHKFSLYGLSGKSSVSGKQSINPAFAPHLGNSDSYLIAGGISAISQIRPNLSARPESG
jgi:hypothetical protein